MESHRTPNLPLDLVVGSLEMVAKFNTEKSFWLLPHFCHTRHAKAVDLLLTKDNVLS